MGVGEAVTYDLVTTSALPLPPVGRGQRLGWLRRGHTVSGTTPTSGSSPQGGGGTRELSDDDQAFRNTWAPRSLVAGIGFRHGAEPDEIVALICRAIQESGRSPAHLVTIATAEDRTGERTIREAAAAFGLVPTGVSAAEMIAVDVRVPTRSSRIEASRLVGSVAEAAALAAAGEGGTLVLTRIASGSVTCALALPAHFATQAP